MFMCVSIQGLTLGHGSREYFKGFFSAFDRVIFFTAGIDWTEATLFDRRDGFVHTSAQFRGIGLRECSDVVVLPRIHRAVLPECYTSSDV